MNYCPMATKLIKMNEEQARRYCHQSKSRRTWRKQNGVRYAWFGCSDGRANPYDATGLPLGTLETHYNIGAEMNLGWNNLRVPVDHWYNYTTEKEECSCVAFCSYHFCDGHDDLGCAGHNNKTDMAIACAERLKAQFERCFDPNFMTPIVVGLETTTRSLKIHDPKGDILDMLELTSEDLPLQPLIESRFDGMNKPMTASLAAILESNLRLCEVSRKEHHSYERVGHHETGVMFGRDTDWAMTNEVLKISPYPLDMVTPLEDAAKILWRTFRHKHKAQEMPAEPFVLLTTGVYYDAGSYEELLAKEEAIALARLGHKVMTSKVEQMHDCLQVIPGTVNHDNRSFTPIEDFEL